MPAGDRAELAPSIRWSRREWTGVGLRLAWPAATGCWPANLVVYPTKTRRWGYKIGDRFGPRTYPTANEAKLALFDDFWVATQDDEQLWSSD